jgi:signal transduction histidine kinase
MSREEVQDAELARLAALGRLSDAARLSGGVAHAVRNALVVLQTQLTELETKLATTERVAPGTTEILSSIRGAVKQLAAITEEAVRFVRTDPRDDGATDPRGEVERACSLVRLHSTRVARLTVHTEETPLVRMRPASITQVVLHLVLRACESFDRTWRPLGRIDVSLRPEAGGALLEIADDGPPLEPSERAALEGRAGEDPRFGADPGARGVGLLLCEVLVRRAGGHITVTEPPEGGNRVAITLPTVAS